MTATQVEVAAARKAPGSLPMSPTDLFVMIDRVVPEAEHAMLDNLRSQADAWYWAIGDLANRWYEYVVANDVPATKSDVCALISHKLDDDRLGASSVELYARVAAFFSDPFLRRRYEVLPTSHLRYAAAFEEGFEKVLEYDLDQMDKRCGRPISRKRLESHFSGDRADAMSSDWAPPEERAEPRAISDAALPAEPDILSQIRSDTARLRNNLELLQSQKPGLARTVARIIALTNKVLAAMP